MPSPVAQAIPNEVKRASSAAASAGTICSGRVMESSWVIEAARIPNPPAISEVIRVFTIEIRFGDWPERMAATSFSDAARVASPNLVHRYSAHSAAATTITRPARMNLSTGMTTVSLSRTRFSRQYLARWFLGGAEGEQHRRLGDEQHGE